jgi:proline dehydrogenase
VRRVVLAAANERHVREFLSGGPGRGLAKRFVAGESLGEAIATTEALSRHGFRVSLDYLGESVATLSEATAACRVYHQSIDATASLDPPVSLAVKPTQFGVDLSRETCLGLLTDVVAHAKAIGSGVRLDMEDSRHTDQTLWLSRELARRGLVVGVVLQAALYRTPTDLEEILAAGGSVRLCKGAYAEPASVAYPRKDDVDRAYGVLLDRLLQDVATRNAAEPGPLPRAAIATHDERLIQQAIELIESLGIDQRRYEFQMLFGVRRDVQQRLVRRGYPLRVYVPWGPAWYAYLTRRLAERPANLFFVVSALLSEARARHSDLTVEDRAPSLWR